MTPQAAIERALTALSFLRDEEVASEAQQRALLLHHEVPAEDVAYLNEVGLERLMTYRHLVRGNLRDAIWVTMPRTCVRLGPVFEESFSAFLAERGPRTHYLRDVCREFLDHALPSWKTDPRVPPYLCELAEHEVLRIEISAKKPEQENTIRDELALGKKVRFIDAVSLVRYQHAIHELSDDESDRVLPAPTPTRLLVYRSQEHEVRYLLLTELAWHVLVLLIQERKTLGEAVSGGTERMSVPVTESVAKGVADLLADLADRGVLLGQSD